MDTTRLSDAEHRVFRVGHDAALRFNSDRMDIHQDVFKAETETHKIYIGYDDVDLGVYMTLTFKNRWVRDEVFGPIQRKFEFQFKSANEAIARACVFLSEHRVEEPYCTADY